jgi:hypothetical protein
LPQQSLRASLEPTSRPVSAICPTRLLGSVCASIGFLSKYLGRRGFLTNHGVQMSTLAVAEKLKSEWESPKTLWGWFATVDHKELGMRYLATAFIFLILGGLEALAVRVQLARPDQAFLTPEQYDQIFSMHGITMIFWYAQPILSGFPSLSSHS